MTERIEIYILSQLQFHFFLFFCCFLKEKRFTLYFLAGFQRGGELLLHPPEVTLAAPVEGRGVGGEAIASRGAQPGQAGGGQPAQTPAAPPRRLTGSFPQPCRGA